METTGDHLKGGNPKQTATRKNDFYERKTMIGYLKIRESEKGTVYQLGIPSLKKTVESASENNEYKSHSPRGTHYLSSFDLLGEDGVKIDSTNPFGIEKILGVLSDNDWKINRNPYSSMLTLTQEKLNPRYTNCDRSPAGRSDRNEYMLGRLSFDCKDCENDKAVYKLEIPSASVNISSNETHEIETVLSKMQNDGWNIDHKSNDGLLVCCRKKKRHDTVA